MALDLMQGCKSTARRNVVDVLALLLQRISAHTDTTGVAFEITTQKSIVTTNGTSDILTICRMEVVVCVPQKFGVCNMYIAHSTYGTYIATSLTAHTE